MFTPPLPFCKLCAQNGNNFPNVGGGVGIGVGSASAAYGSIKRQNSNSIASNNTPKPCGHQSIPACLAHHRASIHSISQFHSHLCPQHQALNKECETCAKQADVAASNNTNQSNIEENNEPKAAYSYLKSYFVSMLQPSDNKLAMKLFGSKKGVLKEKLRQQEVGHWIIHPCSNFR